MATLPPRSQPTVDAILDRARREQPPGFYQRLDVESIGASCTRAIWYGWRWITPASLSGRAERAKITEDAEIDFLAADLKAVGVNVVTQDESGERWLMQDESGHIGGVMHAVALGIREAPKTWHLCMLLALDDKAWKAVAKDGIAHSQPLRHAEAQALMALAGLERAFFLAVNRNDDDLYSERIEHDTAEGIKLLARGRRVVAMPNPPAGISVDPAWFECRLCPHSATCHGTRMPPKHCRTCMHSTPVDGGAWRCERYGKPLSRDAQGAGCPQHLYLPSLIAGEQVDVIQGHADAPVRGVVYKLRDGSRWVDGDISVQLDDEIPF